MKLGSALPLLAATLLAASPMAESTAKTLSPEFFQDDLRTDYLLMFHIRMATDGGCGPVDMEKIEKGAKELEEKHRQPRLAELLRKAGQILLENQEKTSKACKTLRVDVRKLLQMACDDNVSNKRLPAKVRTKLADKEAGRLIGGNEDPFVDGFIDDDYPPAPKTQKNGYPDSEEQEKYRERLFNRNQYQTCVRQGLRDMRLQLLGEDIRTFVGERKATTHRNILLASHK